MNMAEVINECVSACRKMLLLPHLKVKTVLSCQDKSVIGKPLKVFALQLHLSYAPLNNSFTVELQLNPHPDSTGAFHLSQWKNDPMWSSWRTDCIEQLKDLYIASLTCSLGGINIETHKYTRDAAPRSIQSSASCSRSPGVEPTRSKDTR